MEEDKELEKEALSAESNIPKTPIKRGDISKEIENYLGEENLKLIKSLTKEEYEKFKKLDIDPSKSYFVKGNREKLDKFMAFFLTKCVYERPSYMKIMLKEYIEGYLEKHDEGTFLLGADKQLLFLYLHKETSGIGNTDAWIGTSTLDKTANRNRKGLTTVVLSERTFDLLESSSEFTVIKLGGAVISESTKFVNEQNKRNEAMVNAVIANSGVVSDVLKNTQESSGANRSGKPQTDSSTVFS